MPWIGGAISAGGSLLGGLLSGDASDKASERQAQASAAALAEQRRQYEQTRTDLGPYRDTGALANARLATYLGLGSNGGESAAAIRARLLPQFTTTTAGTQGFYDPGSSSPDGFGISSGGGWSPGTAGTSTVDEAGLAAAIAAQNNSPDANYGSLLRNFTGQDLQNEPGYQFGLSEGNKGIDRASAARGGYDSGATLKALTRFNQDYAGTKFTDAFNRDSQNKQRTYGFLSGTAGAGQNAAAQTATAGANAANNISANLLNTGANQAGYIMNSAANQNNAIQSGIGNYLYGQRTQQQPANASLADYGSTGLWGGGGGSNNSPWWSTNNG